MKRVALLATVLGLSAAPAAASPPVFSGWPGNMRVEATSPQGALVSWPGLTATVGNASVPVICTPASGSRLPLGTTPVSCNATNSSTGEVATTSFSVTVVDTTPPSFSGDASRTIEATGTGGVPSGYTAPTASDLVDVSVTPTCTPSPSAALPLGATTIHCTVKDSRGNSASTAFTITVQDTTPPEIHDLPETVEVDTDGPSPVPVTYDLPTAEDIVDGSVKVTCLPASGKRFPLGDTTVVCTAADKHRNHTSATFDVVVQDLTPPDSVGAFTAKLRGKAVALTWKRPAGDVKGVQITRIPGDGARVSTLYTGPLQAFTDSTVTSGGKYEYRAVAYDAAGNRSKGVAATIVVRTSALLAPTDGQRVTAPPTLRWLPVAGASYYNVQIFRGTQKVLSIWPTKPLLQLRSAWTFQKTHQHLARGLYTWYVWPGFGQLAAARYGQLLGKSTFVVVRGPDAGG
jgi:HYR domain